MENTNGFLSLIPHDGSEEEEFSGGWSEESSFSSRASARVIGQAFADRASLAGDGATASSLVEERLLQEALNGTGVGYMDLRNERLRAGRYVVSALYRASKDGACVFRTASDLFLELSGCCEFFNPSFAKDAIRLLGKALGSRSRITIDPESADGPSRECSRAIEELRLLRSDLAAGCTDPAAPKGASELVALVSQLVESACGDHKTFASVLKRVLSKTNAECFDISPRRFFKAMGEVFACVVLEDETPRLRKRWIIEMGELCSKVDRLEAEWIEDQMYEEPGICLYHIANGYTAVVPDDWGIIGADVSKHRSFGVIMCTRGIEGAQDAGPLNVLAFTTAPLSGLTKEQLDDLAARAGELNPAFLDAYNSSVPLVYEDGLPVNIAEHFAAPSLDFFDLPDADNLSALGFDCGIAFKYCSSFSVRDKGAGTTEDWE